MPLAVRVEGDYSLPAFEDSLKIKVKQPAPFPLSSLWCIYMQSFKTCTYNGLLISFLTFNRKIYSFHM